MKDKTTLKIEKNKGIIPLFLIIITIIIIWLLVQQFSIASRPTQVPTGNIDIFELKCDNNCSCSEYGYANDVINKMNADNSLKNLSISEGNLRFDKDIENYNVLVENNVDKITLHASKNSDKATLYYIYKKTIYNSFNDIPISVGENIVTIVVIAEKGNLTSYRIAITRLDNKGDINPPTTKDENNRLTNITISNGNLYFEKNKTNYDVSINEDIDKITLIAFKESEKSTVTYFYNGNSYSEFNDIKLNSITSIITILVTAENGSTMHYTVVIKKPYNLASVEYLGWYSTNNLNIFSNPIYKNEAIISPGSSNTYEFIIRNKVDQKVKYNFKFDEKSDYAINMRYRLKRNGQYVIGNENAWVSPEEISLSEIEVDYNKADDYILDWKWFDGENDNLIGKLQDYYTLSITLSATTQE